MKIEFTDNQVKTITGTISLSFPFEEQIVIRPTSTTYIELSLITANSLRMSFNFITNSTAYAIWFESQGTDNIIKNGYLRLMYLLLSLQYNYIFCCLLIHMSKVSILQ